MSHGRLVRCVRGGGGAGVVRGEEADGPRRDVSRGRLVRCVRGEGDAPREHSPFCAEVGTVRSDEPSEMALVLTWSLCASQYHTVASFDEIELPIPMPPPPAAASLLSVLSSSSSSSSSSAAADAAAVFARGGAASKHVSVDGGGVAALSAQKSTEWPRQCARHASAQQDRKAPSEADAGASEAGAATNSPRSMWRGGGGGGEVIRGRMRRLWLARAIVPDASALWIVDARGGGGGGSGGDGDCGCWRITRRCVRADSPPVCSRRIRRRTRKARQATARVVKVEGAIGARGARRPQELV